MYRGHMRQVYKIGTHDDIALRIKNRATELLAVGGKSEKNPRRTWSGAARASESCGARGGRLACLDQTTAADA
jgi:hypothetical protein